MTDPQELLRPPWFEDLAAWWVPAVTSSMAARVKPLGLDGSQVLHLCCDNNAWKTQVRLQARAILERLAVLLPDVTITALKPATDTKVGAAATAAWANLLGPDLAPYVLPVRRQDGELWVVVARADIRDALEEHLARHTEALSGFLAEHGFTLWRCTMAPVSVAVVSAPGFPDLELVGDVLLDTWYDVTQDLGPEHPLSLTYGVGTEVDHYVAAWVKENSGPDLMTSRIWGRPVDSIADQLQDGTDLCLVFGLRAAPKDFLHTQLVGGSTWAGIPIRRWDR